MWRLEVAAEGDDERLETWKMKSRHIGSNYVGRRWWKFDPEDGTPQERDQVEKLREEFRHNRFRVKLSANLLMRMQFTKENTSENHHDAHHLDIMNDTNSMTQEIVTDSLRRALHFYSKLQAPDGHWPSDLTGPLFLGPQMVLALYTTGDINVILSSEHQKEMKRYMYNHQNEDGGWGMHNEGHSTMFSSVLNYLALRLMGQTLDQQDTQHKAALALAQKWILDHGSALAIPAWGKYWLAVLGVYEWSGCNPMPPEFWLLPSFCPISPGKILSFCRLVYLPMSYLYGKRFVGKTTELICSLRRELYTQSYDSIDWNKARQMCAKEDLFHPISPALKWIWKCLEKMESMITWWPASLLRDKALKVAMELVHYEDKNSQYLCIGTVEKALSLLACWVEDPNSDAYTYHLQRIHDYLWLSEDGMTMQGNTSQFWDLALSIQAIISSGFVEEQRITLARAHDFLKKAQVQENPSGDFTKMYRHATKGAWTFSTATHGWQVSDCTAEGLKVALLLSQISHSIVGKKLAPTNLYDAVNIILSLQSSNGGFPAWEPARASRWLEMLNPIEFFEDTFIEREYVECTSSAVQALLLFSKLHPQFRKREIEKCISKALHYVENTQNPDGSSYGEALLYGRWGVCFTYATWFAVEALVAGSRNYKDCPSLQRACTFLLSKQLPCGGWGESYLSCHNKVYTNLDGNRPHAVHTAWALLALIKAGQFERDAKPINQGVKALINLQMVNGDFPQQEFTGAFMRYCMLNYSSYKNIFPIWALGEYRRRVLLCE